MKNSIFLLAILLLAACTTVVPPTPRAFPQKTAPIVTATDSLPSSLPNSQLSTTVTNPASGAALSVQVFYPQHWDGQTKLPALVLVPGGNGASNSFLKQQPSGSSVDVINQAGYIAIIFDPDGRGKSGGKENYNGFIQQDGLAEVIRFAASLSAVDSTKIGLVTYSYGITMGAGALARHPDLPVKFLIDWEGPANRNDTGNCDDARVGHLGDVASCTDEDFWAEREASTFIGQIRVPYQRLQSEKDHVQPDNAHAILMINNAVNGGVPWVRLNNEAPNQTYDPANPPAMLPDAVLDRQQDQWVVQCAEQLFNSPPSDNSHPSATDIATPQAKAPDATTPYLSFIINVHDWTHPNESADILLKLIDLFEHYGVRGDFYFTAEVTRKLSETHPEVIERFRTSNMTISYHVRPPHPLYTGFDQRLKGLDDATLYQTLLDYETYALNLETGELDRSQPGGYTYVAQVFGRKPVVASAPSEDHRIKDTAEKVYASLRAQMTLRYHEEGTEVEQPFAYANGLLVRPSDFSVTRNTIVDGTDNFWWNMMSKPNAAEYYPLHLLELGLEQWQHQIQNSPYGRAPFITALIHENNFYRRGAEGWTSIYFTIEGSKKGTPLSPPFDLNAPDPSTPRPQEEQATIWQAYEQLVAYAATNLNVVTSQDVVALAKD